MTGKALSHTKTYVQGDLLSQAQTEELDTYNVYTVCGDPLSNCEVFLAPAHPMFGFGVKTLRQSGRRAVYWLLLEQCQHHC